MRIFRETQACPLTGLTHDACPGWAITLKRPRCSGGTDDPANLQWLPKAVADVKEEIERQQCPVSVSDSSVPFFEAAR